LELNGLIRSNTKGKKQEKGHVFYAGGHIPQVISTIGREIKPYTAFGQGGGKRKRKKQKAGEMKNS